MTINDTFQEIVELTNNLIAIGLSIDEKYPNRTSSTISWQNQTDLSIALKNVPYGDKFNTLEKTRNYNFKMLDGAIIQILYQFNVSGRKLLAHRLAFFPSPLLNPYDENPDSYEQEYFGQSEFHDMLEENIVGTPIRFDYNSDDKRFKEIEHPYSHVTFGEYKYCRIPMNAPISPSSFLNFIILNFYNYAIRSKGKFLKISNYRFPNTIVGDEKKIIHFNLE